MSGEAAWACVSDWLGHTGGVGSAPTEAHADVLGQLVTRHRPTSDLIPDAHLAALALEHGVSLCSADTDFARFTELRWVNPLAQ